MLQEQGHGMEKWSVSVCFPTSNYCCIPQATDTKTYTWNLSGSEKDLGEVMQIDNVFLNVSKGQAANKEDLLKCFKTVDRNAIILEVTRVSLSNLLEEKE